MNDIQFKRCEKCCVEGMYNRDDILCPDCDSELILLSLIPAQDLARITAENIALRKVIEKAVPHLESCAHHHRDDYFIEDELMPEIHAALKS